MAAIRIASESALAPASPIALRRRPSQRKGVLCKGVLRRGQTDDFDPLSSW
jgi:hypothetical protein